MLAGSSRIWPLGVEPLQVHPSDVELVDPIHMNNIPLLV